MNRVELIEHLAQTHELSKAEAGRILETLTTAIMGAVKKGDGLTLVGFGTFKKVSMAARKGFNPRDQKPIKIPAKSVPKFVPGSAFRDLVDPKAAKRRAAK